MNTAEQAKLDKAREGKVDWKKWGPFLSPMLGMLAAILACSSLARRIEVAKLYHFESDRRRLFHRMAGRT